MPFTSRLRPIYAVLLLLSSPLTALAASDKIYYPSFGKPPAQTAAEKQADTERRTKIVNDAQNIFTLTGAEIAATRGQKQLALNTYIEIFNKTRSPEVAERGMELAIANKSYTAAEQIFTQWQKVQPESSVALRRMALLRALYSGDYAHVNAHLPQVLGEADEKYSRQIFLHVAQASLTRRDLPTATYDAMQHATSSRPDWLEAQLVALLFNAKTKRESQAIATLQNLVKLDTELTPKTQAALVILLRDHPDIWARFFSSSDSTDFPMIWQELEVEHLIDHNKIAQAYAKLQKMAEKFPEEDFSLRAALLSQQENNPLPETLSHFNKAYQNSPTQAKKSHAASLAALYLLDKKQPSVQIQTWLERIQAADYALDRHILHMALLTQEKKWQEILAINEQVQRQGLRSPKILGQDDYHSFYLHALHHSNVSAQKKLAELAHIVKQNQKNLADEESRRIYSTALYYRGSVYFDELNQLDKGIADFRQYWQMNPDSALAMNALGYSLLERGVKQGESFELIKKAYQKSPEDAAINDSMGWAYFKRGDSKTALPYLQYAYKHDDNAEIGAHLGEVYWDLGDKVKARAIWRENWEKNKKHKILLRTLKRYQIQFK